MKLKPLTKETAPDIISVTFTEQDRQTADDYMDNCNCLLATALRRMGFSGASIGANGSTSFNMGTDTELDYSPVYARDEENWFDSNVENDAAEKPFYKSEVVGRTLTLKLVERSK